MSEGQNLGHGEQQPGIGTGRTYQFSFGSFTLAPGFPELSPEQVLMVDQTWKERAALLLEQVVREILGPQPGVLGALTPEMIDCLGVTMPVDLGLRSGADDVD